MIETGILKISKANGQEKIFQVEILDEWKILEQREIR
jgi:hypothetical protein